MPPPPPAPSLEALLVGTCRRARAPQPPASPTKPPPRPCLLPSMAPRLLTDLSPPPQQRHPPLGTWLLRDTPQLSLPARPQQQPFPL